MPPSTLMLTVDSQSNAAALTDSSELVGTVTHNTDASEEISPQPLEAVQETPQPIAVAIAQSLVQLAQAVQPANMVATAATPETVLEAMQRLVDMIVELQFAEISQTPDTLLPYVTEEAYDLLDALQQHSIQPAPQPPSPSPTIEYLHQDYCSIADLTPWLLWAIARSSYEVMQLMEGMEVQIAYPDQEWQLGVLRLAIALQFDSPEISWSVDLVTHQPCLSLLSSTTQIQSPTLNLDHPLLAGEFVQQVMQQIQRATPGLCPFVAGIHTTLLMPQQPWQSGELQLHFGLEFIPTTTLQPSTPSSQSDCLKPLIQFTDAIWSNTYSAIVNQQHLAAILIHLQTSGSAHAAIHLSSTPSVIEIVEAALTVTNQLQQSSTLASRNISHQIWELSQLNSRLLWCVSRGADEIMQLMAGIAARVLQPTYGWQTGTLRLAVNFKLQTPELDWQLDLVTGRPVPLQTHFLVEDALVRSQQTEWCQSPTLVKHLTHKVMQDIQHATPEIELLLNGADINLQQADEPWQPGTLQLITGFEFVPDRATGQG